MSKLDVSKILDNLLVKQTESNISKNYKPYNSNYSLMLLMHCLGFFSQIFLADETKSHIESSFESDLDFDLEEFDYKNSNLLIIYFFTETKEKITRKQVINSDFAKPKFLSY